MTMTETKDKTEVGQYLTFVLDDEIYAVDVQNAQTVIENARTTRIPRVPEFVLGVIDFRGSVVPLIDLRAKFGIVPRDDEAKAIIVILDIPWNGRSVVLGVTVDEVKEVIEFGPDVIEDARAIGFTSEQQFITGVAKKDNVFILVLDAEKILDSRELSDLGNRMETAAENPEESER